MTEKRAMDPAGAAALTGFALLLAFNQVVVKITGEGFAPVFQAGLRSAGAALVVLIWMRARRVPVTAPRAALIWGLLSGMAFAFEFACLYVALDLTTVARASIIFYSMPVWLGFAAHLWLPGERITPAAGVGMALALAGVVLALADRSNGQASLLGDLLALIAALGWASIILLLRMTPLTRISPVMQLLLQVAVSAPILLVLAPLFGPLIRDPQPIHYAGLAFQAVCVVGLGYIVWFHLMSIFRASAVASFSFLSPVFAVLFGWLILGERIGLQVWGALALVALGILLINRK
ncbi:DMT family transporter [Antarcticimicrobium sediminis]|uniref:DMT family transporter n=1 Tax=Antarcticimicrobium sediminis TaxID=2546227 RepID=A0A4R5EZU7_9RHOB|nr:DMT family transporter [Antarcticimicrobium sediminis]TDE40410.1 DMT family transporter [Antarcticimicrobium sediminis]